MSADVSSASSAAGSGADWNACWAIAAWSGTAAAAGAEATTPPDIPTANVGLVMLSASRTAAVVPTAGKEALELYVGKRATTFSTGSP